MQRCDVLENHEICRKPMKQLVAVGIAVPVCGLVGACCNRAASRWIGSVVSKGGRRL